MLLLGLLTGGRITQTVFCVHVYIVHKPGVCSFSWIFDNFPVNSKKLGVQAPENCELENWFCNFTFISLVLFLYVLPIYNIVMVICLNQQQNAN